MEKNFDHGAALAETLEKIEAAEQRLGGVQAQVLELALLTAQVSSLKSELRIAETSRKHLDSEAAKRAVDHSHRMEDIRQAEARLDAKIARLEALEQRLAPTIQAADRIAAVAESLPDLENRSKALTASESAAQVLLTELTSASNAAGLRRGELLDLDRRLAQRIQELGRVEASVQGIMNAVDALRQASQSCGDLEERVKRIQEAEQRLAALLAARELSSSGGRQRRVI